MALWLVDLPDFGGVSRVGDVKKMIVEADSAAIAKAMAASRFEGDSDWASATATDLSTLAAASLVGFRYEVKVGADPAAPGPDVVVVNHTATAQTVDQVGTALAAALNAHALIAGAAYDTGTNVLTVAAIADALGDRTLSVKVYPPGHAAPVTAMVSTFVHQGIEAAVLTCVLVAPTAFPKVLVTA